MFKVIFACVHNAGRSQMAAAFFNQLADRNKAEGISAGTDPGPRVHPEVLTAMREIGIDLSSAKPQKLTEELAREAQLLITMGCGDNCPFVPGLRGTTGPFAIPRACPLKKSASSAMKFARECNHFWPTSASASLRADFCAERGRMSTHLNCRIKHCQIKPREVV